MGFIGYYSVFFGGDGISIGFDWDLFGFIWLEFMAMQLA